MGREWHLCRSIVKGDDEPPAVAPAGCMGGMLQYLDFHRILVPGGGGRASTDRPPAKRGVVNGFEAPRNSLEESSPPSLEYKFKDIEIGVQISPACDALAKMSSSASSNSVRTAASEAETPRTPSLVARLMGFDGLPETPPAPTPTSTAPKKADKKQRLPLQSINVDNSGGTRSLPDTPRPSSARPSWDLDPRRLSLQLSNKENVQYWSTDHRSLPPSPTAAAARQLELDRLRDDAREIVKLAKENVSNRRACKPPPQALPPLTPKKISTICTPASSTSNSSGSCVDEKWQHPNSSPAPAPAVTKKATLEDHIPNLRSFTKPPRSPEKKIALSSCKKDGCERFTARIKKPPSRPPPPPPPPSRLLLSPKNQILRLHGDEEVKQMIATAPPAPATAKESYSELEYKYILAVLDRGGLMQRPFLRPYSQSTPVDPIVFHRVELDLHNDDGHLAGRRLAGPLRHRWNRKLLFNLVEEVLSDLILSGMPVAGGEHLIRRMWGKIRSMPAADCRVLGDIDCLIAGDIPVGSVRGVLRHPAVAGERRAVADDVARRVLDGLVGELAKELFRQR